MEMMTFRSILLKRNEGKATVNEHEMYHGHSLPTLNVQLIRVGRDLRLDSKRQKTKNGTSHPFQSSRLAT